MSSDAVGSSRVSTVVGYKITKGVFNNSTPNLPQRVALFGEANNANQTSLDLTPVEITSAQQAGELYGFGSPIHMAMRIIRPSSGVGIGGIPVFAYPQAEAGGASAKIMEINPTGVATGNGTHTVVIAGREFLEGGRYDINIATGDDAADISGKIEDAVNAVLGCPFTPNDSTYSTILTSKWKGETAEALTVTMSTNGNDLGIVYTIETVQAGTGTPSLSAALALFGEIWNTLVLNTYSTNTGVMAELEAFNGIPDPLNPTGRYSGIIMKPFIALTGSIADDPSDITEARLNDVTIAICPAPASAGHPLEAAANMCVLFAKTSQDKPHIDILDQTYADMPVPADGDIGSMASYESRDSFVKKGCSTVALNGNRYAIKDFVTTYHPVGETPPQFRYCRNLMLDFNVRYGYYLLEQTYVVGATIAGDNDNVTVDGVIKPKTWTQIINQYFEDLESRALVSDSAFTADSLVVEISSTTPYRLETFFRYKRTSTARIASTTAEAGFNFG